MEVFEKIITVQQEDLDQLNHVNNVKYVQWVQDIAENHWLKRAPRKVKENYFWIMIAHNIEYKSPSFLGDKLLVKTYVTRSDGVTSTRQVEFLNFNSNKLLVKSVTTWCLMNASSHKPTRITEELKALFN